MTIAFRLRFFRDLGWQFGTPPTGQPNFQSAQSSWSVLGAMDYVQFDPISSLSDISRYSIDKDPTLSGTVGGETELVIVPSVYELATESVKRQRQLVADGEFTVEHQKKVAKLGFLGGDIKHRCRMAAFIRLTLSSIAIDRADDYSDILAFLRKTENVLKLHVAGFKDASIWATLGGPDFVVLIPIDHPASLAKLYELVSKLRNLSGREVGIAAVAQNHAFSSIQANFIYRDYALLLDELKNYDKPNDAVSPRFVCRVTVGPGHELPYIRRATYTLQSQCEVIACTWAYRSVFLQCSDIRVMLQAIHQGLYLNGDPNQPRYLDVVGHRTSILFEPDSTSQELSHPIATLSEELVERLSITRESLAAFGQFLGPTQRRELRELILAWEGAFQRNDRAVAVRDLLPFFSQLGACLKHSKWIEFLESDSVRVDQSFNSDIMALLTDSWRAIRNRVEQKGEPADPAFPNTLESGASKLVNAYTVAGWLGWECLRDATNPPPNCADNQFAACVTAGQAGRVLGETIFADFREHVKTLPDEGWNAPLVLLKISGHILYSPDLAFAHFLHEVTEFCEWLSLPGCAPIRSALNRWTLTCFCRAVADKLDEMPHVKSRYTFSDLKPLELALSLMLPGINDEHPLSSIAFNKRMEDHFRSIAPVKCLKDFVNTLHFEKSKIDIIDRASALANAQSGNEFVESYSGLKTSLLARLPHIDVFAESQGAPSLAAWCQDFGRHIEEVFADIGAWCALDHILGTVDGPRNWSTRCLDLRLFYASVLSSTLEVYPIGQPERVQAAAAIGSRWAVQVAAASRHHQNWFSTFETEFKAELAKHKFDAIATKKTLGLISAFHSLFPPGNGDPEYGSQPLSAVLMEYAPYGGTKPVKMPGHNVGACFLKNESPAKRLSEAVASVWVHARQGATDEGYAIERIWLAFQFWAKSQRFCVPKLFK